MRFRDWIKHNKKHGKINEIRNLIFYSISSTLFLAYVLYTVIFGRFREPDGAMALIIFFLLLMNYSSISLLKTNYQNYLILLDNKK